MASDKFPAKCMTCTTGKSVKVNWWALYWCLTELHCYKQNPCHHGGHCHEDLAKHSYKCTCHPGYAGRHCQTSELLCCLSDVPLTHL